MFQILPIEEIFENGIVNQAFCFAEYMIYSDEWRIQVKDEKEYSITNSNHGADKTVVLTHSIKEFFESYLKGGLFGNNGLYHWYEDKKASA